MNAIGHNFAKDSAVADRSALTRAFDIVHNAIERERTNYAPILANARLIGDGSNLFVTATDLDLELTVAIPGSADSSFALTLPAAKMRDLLKKATASNFVAFTMPEIVTGVRKNGEEFEEFAAPATVDFERVKYRLPAIVVGDFPTLGRGNPNHKFTMPGAALWRAIDATIGAVSTEGTRYYLNGIYCHVSGENFRMVATDGHRLYKQDLPAPEGSSGMEGVILPSKAVKLLHKLLKGKACPGSVTIEASGKRLAFQWDDVTLITKTIDGTFPDYRRVIPTANDKRASFDVETMLEAIRAVALIKDKGKGALKFDYADGACTLSAHDHDNGAATATIGCDYTSEALTIGINSAYLIDAITTAVGDESTVSMVFADANCPMIITGADSGWLGVIMPMSV